MKSRNKHLLSIIWLAALLVFAVGSVDSNSVSDRPSASIPEGNRVIVDADKGTTLQKQKHIEANKGKAFDFEGEVDDVTGTFTIEVQLESGCHATVVFNHSVETIEKGAQIKFRATIESFGTGIFVNHSLTGADLQK
jgi:hypothetical protein